MIINCFIIGLGMGLVFFPYFRKRLNKQLEQDRQQTIIYQVEPTKEEPPEMPFFVKDELNALDEQITSYYKLYMQLGREVNASKNELTKAKLNARRSDISAKLARLETKAQKIYDKYNIPS